MLSRTRGLTVKLLCLLATLPSCHAFTQYSNSSCQLIGDSDVYGIGVHTSYYLSFFAVIVAMVFGNRKAIRECVKGLNVITFAILVVLTRNATQGSFAIFEWLLVFPMVTLPSIGVLSLFSWEASAICGCFGIVYGIFSVLQPWLYFRLLYQGARLDCNPRWFIFTYFNLYNNAWIRFFKVMSIVTCVGGVLTILASAAILFHAATTSAEELKEKDETGVRFKMGVLIGGKKSQRIQKFTSTETSLGMRIVSAPGFSVSGVVTIIFTEKILSGNDVDLSEGTLDSTSQLIPLLVGIFTFVATVYGSIKDRK